MDASIRKGKAELDPGKEWFVGYNMTKTVFPPGKYHKSYLDERFGGTPVFIYLEGQHEAIANSRRWSLRA